MADERLHGVLVTYQRPHDLALMLARLDEQQRQLDTLVIVDNDPAASAREVAERYGNGHAEVTYIPAGDNLGPAGGLAVGMTHVLTHAHDRDWAVLLDDDDPPASADVFAELAELGSKLRDQDPMVGAVGKSGSDFRPAKGRSVRIPDEKLTGAVPSDCIGGNQLPFYSIHAIRSVGVFDQRLFFGFDDLEYGLRLRSRGFSIYVHGGLWYRDRERLGRLSLQTPPQRTLGDPSWRRYYSLRNMIYILRQQGHPLAALRVAGRSVAKPVVNVPLGPSLAVRHLRLNLRAVTDAYTGRMGRTVEPHAKVSPLSVE